MKKRLIALLLAGTMVVFLAACGSDGDTGSTPNDSTENVQQSTPSDSTPDSTPEDSSSDENTPRQKFQALLRLPCLPTW